MGYRININETFKDCQRFTLTEPFPEVGPYLSDKYDGEFVIGSSDMPKDGVEVVAYSGSTERGWCEITW